MSATEPGVEPLQKQDVAEPVGETGAAVEETAAKPFDPSKIWPAIVAFLSSYFLSVLTLVLLLVVTLKGTIAQVDLGLFGSQVKYFESFWFRWELGGRFALYFPGGYLLLTVLFVNLLVGGLVRIRKRKATVGIIIGHVGVLGLLFTGFVEYQLADRGSMKLYNGDKANEFVSFHDYEIVIAEHKGDRLEEWSIDWNDFRWVGEGQSATFRSELPFDLSVERFFKNARPRVAKAGEGIDGIRLAKVRDAENPENNMPGCIVEMASDADGRRGLLWVGTFAPWVVKVEGRTFGIKFRRKRFALPFEIELRKFRKVDHPGTRKPKEFSSDVTERPFVNGKAVGSGRDLTITMNEPLRQAGYVLYQADWGPKNPRSSEPPYSGLQVASNPTDQWPKWLCWVIAIGLTIHFLMKLFKYAKAQTKLRTS